MVIELQATGQDPAFKKGRKEGRREEEKRKGREGEEEKRKKEKEGKREWA